MTPVLVAVAAAATFGVGAVTTASLDYAVQLNQQGTVASAKPVESLPLAAFGIGPLVCIRVRGHSNRRVCEGTATKIPPLVPAANSIPLPVPVPAFVAKEGDRNTQVALDFSDRWSGDVAAQMEAVGKKFELQLKGATRCGLDTGDTQVWRAGPAYMAFSMPVGNLLFATPDVQIDVGAQGFAEAEWLSIPTGTTSFHPLVTAGDCNNTEGTTK